MSSRWSGQEVVICQARGWHCRSFIIVAIMPDFVQCLSLVSGEHWTVGLQRSTILRSKGTLKSSVLILVRRLLCVRPLLRQAPFLLHAALRARPSLLRLWQGALEEFIVPFEAFSILLVLQGGLEQGEESFRVRGLRVQGVKARTLTLDGILPCPEPPCVEFNTFPSVVDRRQRCGAPLR